MFFALLRIIFLKPFYWGCIQLLWYYKSLALPSLTLTSGKEEVGLSPSSPSSKSLVPFSPSTQIPPKVATSSWLSSLLLFSNENKVGENILKLNTTELALGVGGICNQYKEIYICPFWTIKLGFLKFWTVKVPSYIFTSHR